MGNFGGHVFPGLFFVLVGVWWTIQILSRYYRAIDTSSDRNQSKSDSQFTSSVTFPVQTRFGLFHIESFVIFCVSLTGLLLELVIIMPSSHQGITPANIQHATLYLAFGLAFLSAAILPRIHYLPGSLVYVSFILAFLTEYLILLYHSLGTGNLHKIMHRLLGYAVLGCAVTTCLEISQRKSLLVALSRAFFMMLQGIWFIQVGFILFPPATNFWGTGVTEIADEHQAMMVQTCVFTWYMMAVGLFVLVCWAVIGACHGRQKDSGQMGNQAWMMKQGQGKLLRYALVPQKDEEI